MAIQEETQGASQFQHEPFPKCVLERFVPRNPLDFELQFFAGILRKDPDYVDVLKVHAENLTAKGEYRRGLELDRRLVKLCPTDCNVHYNLACSYALLGRNNAALRALRRALELGYDDLEHLLRDPDLDGLRDDERFERVVTRYFALDCGDAEEAEEDAQAGSEGEPEPEINPEHG